MNKKFTMVCASLLLTSAFTVNAETFDNPTSHIAIPEVGNTTIKLVAGANEGLYQITVNNGTQVLSMDDEGRVKAVANDFATNANRDFKALARTLWCVTVSTENQGQAPKYDFMNKATGLYLDMTMAGLEDLAMETQSGAIEVGGEIGGWAFSKTFKDGLETCRYAAFNATDNNLSRTKRPLTKNIC